MWSTLLRCGLQFVQWHLTCHPVKNRDSIVHGKMESPKTRLQAIDLIPSSSEQAHSNRLNIGQGYESTKLVCILTLLRVPSIIRPLGGTRLVRSTQLSSKLEEKLFWPSTPIFISCLKSVTRKDSFFTQCHKMITEYEQSV